MFEVSIDSIRVSLMNYQRVVILKVKDTTKYLPIWIGPSEADSIALKLQDVSVPRPLTHDLLHSAIQTLGAQVSRIVVSDLNNDTFFATIVLEHKENTVELDARPSDAIALAVRTGAPIFADDSVVEKAGIHMDDEPSDSEGGGWVSKPVREEDLKGMSAFTDFIGTLNLDDIGRGDKPPEPPSQTA